MRTSVIEKLLHEVNSNSSHYPKICCIEQAQVRRGSSLVQLRSLWLNEFDAFKKLNPDLHQPELSNQFDKIFNDKYLKDDGGIRIWQL